MPARLATRMCLFMLTITTAAAAWCATDEPPPFVPRVAIFDFTDPSAWTGRMVGIRAADATFAALRATHRWELIDRSLVLHACRSEGLTPPFAVGHVQMIGERLQAPLAVTGLVEVCRVNPERRTAQVTVVAELIETLGGNSLASVRGVASARVGEEPEALAQIVDRALMEAAGDLARALTGFDPAGAQVVMTLPDGRVVLDVPEGVGLRPGDVLLVCRGRERCDVVGALRVQTVNLTVVHARPLAGDDFEGGDRAILVAR